MATSPRGGLSALRSSRLEIPMLALAPRLPDEVVQRSAPPVHIGAYDGPLDLLLMLVRREGLDVRNVPIAPICTAYLAALKEADIDVDAAGDYLVLAATLCQLKVRELLPRVAPADGGDPEDEEDPKERLTRRLLEYERYRAAAEDLGRRARLDRDVYAHPAEPASPDEQPVDPTVDALGLLRLYYELETARAKPAAVHEVHRETMSLAETARWILSRLDDGVEHGLAELFVERSSKAGRVYTFLSVLEMARLRLLDLTQQMHLGAIRLLGRVRAQEADLGALPEEL